MQTIAVYYCISGIYLLYSFAPLSNFKLKGYEKQSFIFIEHKDRSRPFGP